MIPWKIINGETEGFQGKIPIASVYGSEPRIVDVVSVSRELAEVPGMEGGAPWWKWMLNNGWTHWTPIDLPVLLTSDQ